MTDPGVLDRYLASLKDRLEGLQEEVAGLQDRLVLAQLQDAAKAKVSAADQVALAGLLDAEDATALQGRIQTLQGQAAALKRLRTAAKSA